MSLDRSATEQTEMMLKFGSVRRCKVEKLELLELFIDRSVIEIFVNDGEKVLTSRFFIENRENLLKTSRPIEMQIAKIAQIAYQ